MKVEKIRGREITALILLMLITKIADSTPVILAHYAKNAFWMLPIISFLIFIPSYLLLLKVLYNYKDKNLIEIVNHVLGRQIGFFVGFCIFALSFLFTMLNSRIYVDIVNTIYFPESPVLIMYCILIGVSFFGARKGFTIITSTSWLVIPYIMGSLALLALLAFKVIIIQRVFPIFGEGLGVLLKQGLFNSSIYFDLLLITMAFTSVTDPSSFKKGTNLGSIIAVFQMTLFYFIYCTFFDYKSIGNMAFPFHEISNYVTIGQFFTNIETFFFSFWLLMVLIRFMALLYLTSWVFSEVFNIKNVKAVLLPIVFLTVSLGIIPDSPVKTIFFFKDRLLNMVSIPLLLFPLLLWLVGKLKGDYTRNV